MKYLYLLPLGLALMTASCKSTKTASTNPYQSNPYYGPSGSSYGSSTTDYSSTASSSTYPSYSENTYKPPTQSSSVTLPSAPPAPSVPSVPSYSAPAPIYSTPAPATYTAPASTGGSHTVSSGENLYRISLKHGTSVAAIKSANGMSSDTIHPGQVLRIP
ncbi:MAG: LysM peptidoglycan-binding domain-containing protein [Verrucomicrobiales bacterium]|nr:LysM peptidoglycan-binding domain-containing protein [Verrucomicrobiales bacterium]